MPRRQQALARRIVASFVLLTLLVSGLFSLMVIEAASRAEDFFSEESLNQEFQSLLAAESAGQPLHASRGTQLYVVTPAAPSNLPPWLAGMGPGYHEVEHDNAEQHILIHDVGERRYVLVQVLEEFERREDFLKAIVAAAFACSVLAAWGIGVLLSRRVIAPLTRLAGQVRHRAQLLPLAPPLAPDYANDEVGQLAAAFDETMGTLREALERERLFTSDVSHELRTPLMVIASTCDLLLAQGLRDSHQEEKVRRMLDSCAEMRELVEVFLRLARAPQEKGGDGGAVPLGEVAQEQIEHWRAEAAARNLELTLTTEAADTGCYPAPQLRAVIANLLRNALHYTDKGFVRLVLRSEGFSVCDSGAGIPPERRESIFQPFVRGDASRGDGLGLGLSLVQRICRQQGWRIRLDEYPGGGCEFRVDFSAS